MMRLRLLVWPCLCLLLGGCTAPGPGPANASNRDANAAFSQTADDFIGGWLAFRPQTGSALGLHQYDGKAGDFSQVGISAELARLKAFDQQLSDMGTSGLTAQNSLDFRLLRDSNRREIFGIEVMGEFSRNPVTYVNALDVRGYFTRDFAPLPDRIRAADSILNQAPIILGDARTNLETSMPRPLVESAIAQAGAAADFLEKDAPTAIKGISDATLQTEFNVAEHVAIRELRAYADWLTTMKLPQANDQYGLGRDNFIRLLQCGEIGSSPEQLLVIGERELAGKQQIFAETARAIDPSESDPVAVFRAIQKEHPDGQSLVPDVARGFESVRQFVNDRHLVSLPPDAQVTVSETPPFLRGTTFAAMEIPGPFETKATRARYYVTPVDTNWPAAQQEQWLEAFNFYAADIQAIHEAWPGHYLQAVHLNNSPATAAEKIFGTYAFEEGWAHYCEQMVIDEGFGAESTDKARAAKFRLAQTQAALLRVCRMCTAIRINCEGMTIPEAEKFFADNCHCDAQTAHDEAVRAACDPECLYYTVGKLEILKLREDYRRQEGSAFSLEKFHDELLRHGMPPIRLLREVMLKDATTWDTVL